MRRAAVCGLAGWMLVAGAAAQEAGAPEELPPLPKWERADLEKLRNGEIIPGSELLREVLEDLKLPPPPPVEQPEALTPEPGGSPIEAQFPTEIGTEYIGDYFARRPASFMLDPQELLSMQEFRDRVSFLEYHAGDSDVDLYLYLFDARQELPEGVTIDSVFEDHFAGGGPTALVFYFLGMPEKAQMVLSDEIRAAVTTEEQERALKTAIQEAFEKSDPADQLDNFSVELSIRLYWFEKAMKGPEPPSTSVTPDEDSSSVPAADAPRENRGVKMLVRGFWVVGVIVLAGGLGWAGRMIANRRVRYVFPEVETGPLLGAPHAAGVGAVVSFSSSQLPPSKQRDQVPDYLQRM